MVRQVGEGLHALRVRGILHRDVKPANLLLRTGANGTVRAMVADLHSLASLTCSSPRRAGRARARLAVWVGGGYALHRVATRTVEVTDDGGTLSTTMPQHPACASPLPAESSDGGDRRTVVLLGCPGVIVERVVQVTDDRLMWVQVRSDDRAAADRVLGSVRARGL